MKLKNQQTRTYLNACDLLIDSFTLAYRGSVYFLWKKGSKQTQSLKYITKGDLIQPRQTLSLTVKTYHHFGIETQRSTHLLVFSTDGKQIDAATVQISAWKNEFSEFVLKTSKGHYKLQGKKALITELENFHQTKQEVEESSEESNLNNSLRNSQMQRLQKQEMVQLRKEVEDSQYLVVKLKNDRTGLLSRVHMLEDELGSLNQKVLKEVNNFQDYFRQKIEIRESIYEEEIQQMVNTINQNNEKNVEIIQQLTREKFEYEREIERLKEEYEIELERVEFNYEAIVGELEANKIDLEHRCTQKDSQNKNLQDQNSRLELLVKTTQMQLKETSEMLQKQKQKGEKESQDAEKIMTSKEQEITQYLTQIANLKSAITDRDFTINDNQQQIKLLEGMLEDEKNVQSELEVKLAEVQGDKYKADMQISKLMTDIDTLNTEIKILKHNVDFQKEQNKNNVEEYKLLIQNMEKISEEKQGVFLGQLQETHEKVVAMEKKNYETEILAEELNSKLQMKEDEMSIMSMETTSLKDFIQTMKKQNRINNEHLMNELQTLNENMALLNAEKAMIESQNNAMKEDLVELESKLHNETENKKDFEDIIETKTKLLEDELEYAKNERDTEQLAFDKIKEEYEKQIDEIISRNKAEVQEIEEHYKEDLELKTSEHQDLMNRFNGLQKAHEELKLQATAPQQFNHFGALDYEDIEEVSEQEDEQEIQSESEQEKKKPRKNQEKRKNKQISSSQQSSEEPEQLKNKEKGKGKGKGKLNQSVELVELPEVSTVQRKSGKKKHLTYAPKVQEDQEESSAIQDSQPDFQNNQSIQKRISLEEQTEKYTTKSKKGERPNYTIKLPKSPKMQRRSQQSIQSSTNYQQKVEELEKQLKKARKSQKELLREKGGYLEQIQQLEQEIEQLKIETTKLSKSLKARAPQEMEKIQEDIQIMRSANEKERSMKSKISLNEKHKKGEPSSSLMQENKELKLALQDKVRQIHKLKSFNQEFEEQVTELRATNKHTLEKLKSKNKSHREELERSEDRFEFEISRDNSSKNLFEDRLRNHKADLQDQLEKLKLETKELKLESKFLKSQNQDLKSEKKKLQSKIDEVHYQSNRKIPQNMRQFHAQLQQNTKRIFELTKNLNAVKLDRDTLEDELRIAKKKQTDQSRLTVESQSKAMEYERENDDYRRRELKARRDLEEANNDVRSLKDTLKKLQEEIALLNTAITSLNFEKKKFQELKMEWEDDELKKEHEIGKLNKELQKYRAKLKEEDETKIGKKNSLREDNSRLEALNSQLQKNIYEAQFNNKKLQQRIEELQRQHEQVMEERKATYRQKLRTYIEELTNIKGILDQHQDENSKLKIQNSEFFEQNQILRGSFENLENKYEDLLAKEEDMAHEKAQIEEKTNQQKEKCSKQEIQLQKRDLLLSALRKELENERSSNLKRTNKIQAYEEYNERYLYEVNTLKAKLATLEDKEAVNRSLQKQCSDYEALLHELEEELRKEREEASKHLQIFTYRREDVDKAMSELKEHENKNKDEELRRVITELDQTHARKLAGMDKEIITLYNENSNLRVSQQKLTDDCNELLLKCRQYQEATERTRNASKDFETADRERKELKKQTEQLSQERQKLETRLNEALKAQEYAKAELIFLKKTAQDYEKKEKSLGSQYEDLKNQARISLQKYKRIAEEKERQFEKSQSELQCSQNKILVLELEVERLKEHENGLTKEYASKMKKLQGKIEDMNRTYQQHQYKIEDHYSREDHLLRQQLMKCSAELDAKLKRIADLTEALRATEEDKHTLANELSGLKDQLNEEVELYAEEINTLRQKHRNNEVENEAIINNLEEELSAMNKELTQHRFRNSNRNSRLLGSEAGDEVTPKRFEEKLKAKDKKIEELKQTILLMETKINSKVKKETRNESVEELIHLKTTNVELQAQFRSDKIVWENQLAHRQDQLRAVKKELHQLRSKSEEDELILEERELRLNSIECELETTKQLYLGLQNQLEKRKFAIPNRDEHPFTGVTQEEADLLKDQLQSFKSQNRRIHVEAQKKQQDILHLNKLLEEQRDKNQELKKASSQIKKLSEEIEQINRANSMHQTQKQGLKNQIKKLQSEIIEEKNNNNNLKEELNFNQESIKQITMTIEKQSKMLGQIECLAQKYKCVDAKVSENYGISLDECVFTDFLGEKLYEKEVEINQFVEEIEELKFLNDQHNLDCNELKRENYELRIAVEESEFSNQQLQQFRDICTQLEDQKKNAVFREQSLKLQLRSILEQEFDGSQVKQRIESVLIAQS